MTAAEQSAALRAAFPVGTIKVKPQTVTKDMTKGLVTYYVDARIVAERLNEVVGSENWQDEYRVLVDSQHVIAVGTPVECRLTVNGVTKTDVGQLSPGELDDKSWKSAYSDAFKRAAVKFGVGAYLYEAPSVWAAIKVGGNGKAQGFSDEGRAHALSAYERWTSSAPGTGATKPPTTGVSTDGVGDRQAGAAAPSGGEGAEGASAAPADGDPVTAALVSELLRLSREFGANVVTVQKSIDDNRRTHEGYLSKHHKWLERQIATVKANLAEKKAAAESKFQPPTGATEKAA